MKALLLALALLLSALAPVRSFAYEDIIGLDPHFDITSVETIESESPRTVYPVELFNTEATPQPNLDFLSSLVDGLDTLNEFVAVGKAIWKVLQDNKPVVNVTTDRLSVLPKDQPAWQQMEKWQGPVMKTYTVVAKNLLGFEVIRYTYRLFFNYGGQWQGKGKYLANVTIIPEQVDVAWGFALDSSVVAGEIVNMGTLEDPMPAASLQLKWKIKSVMKESQGVDHFYIKGNGEVLRASEQ